ncbi:cysteine-rich receptor-like protein kinase 6 [Oryza sativa Japonica Group]|uniref:cysteine-rich receptor-like protein kinase 6 n=1 Tax=Oryza sativa subsp. japonica TaxID=39947 RepID=UPI00339C1C55
MATRVLLSSKVILALVLASLFSLPRHGRALELMNWSCNNGSAYAANTTYDTNVHSILATLTARTPNTTTGFATATTGRGTDTEAWGLALCRGDTDRVGCASCLAAVPAVAFNECRGDMDVTVFYDRCLARFSYVDFTARPDNTEVLIGSPSADRITADAGHFDALVADLAGALADWAAYNSTLRYAAGVMTSGDGFMSTTEDMVHNIYGVVQCTPDQAAAACRACLEALRVDMPKVFAGKMGGRFNAVWCNLRYETFVFFDGDPSVKLVAPPVVPEDGMNFASHNVALHLTAGKRRSSPENAAAVVGAVLGALVILLSLFIIYLWKKLQAKQYAADKNVDSGSLLFDLAIIRKATANFAEHNKLGHGGFGAVYKGFLPDVGEIAVKRLDRTSGQGLEQLRNELLLVAKLWHNNLAKLLGVCIKGDEKLLVYEFLPNRSLDTILFADPQKREQLSWETRYQIIHGTARGLLYLHEDSQIKIIHRDLKASNVLLDSNMNPKISDFGLARLCSGTKTTSITSQVVGTLGYMAPEYAVLGHLSVKVDVYSFGILVLEIVTGRRNTDVFDADEESSNLLSYVWDHWQKGIPLEITDTLLLLSGSRGLQDMELLKCVHIGLLCVQENPADRPTMLSVLVMLQDVDTTNFAAPSKPAFTFANVRNTTSSSPSAAALSANEVSISEFHPR